MRPLLAAALGLVAAAAGHTVSAAPHPQTLYRPHGRIAAFAQDGPLVAWFSPSPVRCNAVTVLSLANGIQTQLPAEAGQQNVTCRWAVVPPVGLALGGSTLLWTLREPAPLPFGHLP